MKTIIRSRHAATFIEPSLFGMRFPRVCFDEPDDIPAPAPKPVKEPETFSREYVSELRQENKGLRLRASDEERKRKDAETALETTKTESEGKVTAAQQAANERIVRAELKTAAIKAGMVDLDGLKLVDMTKVKLNDAGDVEGADALMEEVKAAKPYLFGDVKSTSNTGKVPDPKKAEVKHASAMTKEEYEAEKRKLEAPVR